MYLLFSFLHFLTQDQQYNTTKQKYIRITANNIITLYNFCNKNIIF